MNTSNIVTNSAASGYKADCKNQLGALQKNSVINQNPQMLSQPHSQASPSGYNEITQPSSNFISLTFANSSGSYRIHQESIPDLPISYTSTIVVDTSEVHPVPCLDNNAANFTETLSYLKNQLVDSKDAVIFSQVKRRVVTFNLVKRVLRFQIERVATQGDLKMFYASIGLKNDQWNLQRVLFKGNLDSNSEPVEAIMKTLILGIKSAYAQSETAIIKLANYVREKQPLFADFLTNSRFVDDLGDGAKNLHILQKVVSEAEELFSQVN